MEPISVVLLSLSLSLPFDERWLTFIRRMIWWIVKWKLHGAKQQRHKKKRKNINIWRRRMFIKWYEYIANRKKYYLWCLQWIPKWASEQRKQRRMEKKYNKITQLAILCITQQNLDVILLILFHTYYICVWVHISKLYMQHICNTYYV